MIPMLFGYLKRGEKVLQHLTERWENGYSQQQLQFQLQLQLPSSCDFLFKRLPNGTARLAQWTFYSKSAA